MFNNEGKTVGLLLCVLEPIFVKGMVVILDSGFCVLRGFIELQKWSVYASTLIKNANIGQNTSMERKLRPILMVRMSEIATHGRE